MQRRNPVALALVALLALAGACTQDEPVEFAVILPLSGEWAVYGDPIRKGVELALEDIGRRGDLPYPVAIEVLDSQSDPAKAAELLEEAFDRGAFAALGGVTSDEALAMVPVADEEERVLVSPSASSPELSGASRYFFRVFPSDFQEGNKMANYAATELKLASTVILAADTTYARSISEAFRREFERNDGEIADTLVYPVGTGDFSEVVRRALDLDPVAVYVADYAAPAVAILAELKEAGFDGKLMTTSAFNAPEVLAAAGESAEDVILTQTAFDPDSEDPRVQSFVRAYEARYGERPGIYAAHGYDALTVLADGLKGMTVRAPGEMLKGLRSLGLEYSGVTGGIQFDERGDVGQFPRVYIYQDGAFVDYDKVREEKRKELLDKLRRIRGEQARRALGTGNDGP